MALQRQIEGIIREHVYANVQYGADGVLSGVPQAVGLILAAVNSAALRDAGTGRDSGEADLIVKAEEQVAYWRQRQQDEKCLEDGISEDGETHTPIGDEAAWQGGYCNGRMSEADWWLKTLQARSTGLSALADPSGGGKP